jgi:hypothetical protein
MPAADYATNPDYAQCPVCGRPYQLTTKGRLRKHWKRDGQGKGLPFSDPCPGSGQTPKED